MTLQRQRDRLRLLLVAMCAMLLLAFAAVGLLQARQVQLLNANQRFQDDSLVWSVFQFEVEYMKLRLALEQAAGPSLAVDADAVEQRYEIFVSRLGLIETEHAAALLQRDPDYSDVVGRARAFVAWADTLPLNADTVREHPALLREATLRMDGLSIGVHELSLNAAHHVAAQLSDRHALVKQQSRVSMGLTVLQVALTLGFAFILIRLFRRLSRSGDEQEALAQSLLLARGEAEAGSRAKSVFLANMSHELRTPMHGLLGMLALLGDTPLKPDQQAHVNAASDSARHLLAVLNDVLDVSKMEAGGITISQEPVALAALLLELNKSLAAQAAAKGLGLSLRSDADVPAWVSADPTRLRQILLNLLSNAIKFSEQGHVALHLSRQTDGLGRSLLRFDVSDTGIGIDMATQARLFQRFSQGDASSSRRFGGTGLGLEISRNLARAMDGDISVTSAPGCGSVFSLELRLSACAPPLPAALTNTAPSAEPPDPVRVLRILVAEDNPTNQVYLAAVLEKLGHLAVLCDDGRDAVKRLTQEDFDLVLMDLHMPVMDGFDATLAMRALPGAKSAIRIIALSADAFEESHARAMAVGMDGFLAKPVGIDSLAAALVA